MRRLAMPPTYPMPQEKPPKSYAGCCPATYASMESNREMDQIRKALVRNMKAGKQCPKYRGHKAIHTMPRAERTTDQMNTAIFSFRSSEYLPPTSARNTPRMVEKPLSAPQESSENPVRSNVLEKKTGSKKARYTT